MTSTFHKLGRCNPFLQILTAKLICCLASGIFMFFALTATAQPASSVLTNTGVIDMHKSGLGSDIILTSIENSLCKFNVTSAGLVALKKSGVEEAVIKAMIQKQSAKAPVVSTVSSTPAASGKTDRKEVASSRPGKGESLSLLNHVYFSSGSGDAKPLEKMVAGIRTKQGPFGGSVLFQVEGAKSGLRLPSGSVNGFMINTGSDVLPELVLYKLKVAKGKREVATMKAGTFTGVKTGEDVITLDISKLGNGTFKITPGKNLEAGEYFFTGKPSQGSASAEAFAFGVD